MTAAGLFLRPFLEPVEPPFGRGREASLRFCWPQVPCSKPRKWNVMSRALRNIEWTEVLAIFFKNILNGILNPVWLSELFSHWLTAKTSGTSIKQERRTISYHSQGCHCFCLQTEGVRLYTIPAGCSLPILSECGCANSRMGAKD